MSEKFELESGRAENPLVRASKEDLLKLSENNVFSFLRRWGMSPAVEHLDEHGIELITAGTQFPLCNAVFSTRLCRADANEVVQAVVADSARRRVSRIWMVTPSTTPSDLGDILVDNGFTLAGENMAMAFDLRGPPSTRMTPEGFSIATVDNDESLKSFVTAMDRAFDLPLPDDAIIQRIEQSLLSCGKDTCRRYVGSVSGSPAGTSLLMRTPGVAGIYCVGTVGAYRGQGIGTMMTVKSMEDAARLGYNYCVLWATPMGHPVYKNIGFEDLGTDKLYFLGAAGAGGARH